MGCFLQSECGETLCRFLLKNKLFHSRGGGRAGDLQTEAEELDGADCCYLEAQLFFYYTKVGELTLSQLGTASAGMSADRL